MKRVVHLIPYDGVGGVEEAARTVSEGAIREFDVSVRYIFPDVHSRAQRGRTFNLLQMFLAARSLAGMRPDALVASLWRSVAVGLVVKALRPRTRLVLFLHNARDAHLADRIITRFGARFASAIWADSATTLAERLPDLPSVPTKVFSFILRTSGPAAPWTDHDRPRPAFVFWGRFAPQKNIPRTLRVFEKIRERIPDACLHLIGATPAEIGLWRARVRERGLQDSVKVSETMEFSKICKAAAEASFYLQTSQYEGMSMSVVEAMQLGLVPVVTPVGEIARYCRDGENAVLLPIDEGDVAAQLRALTQLTDLCFDDGHVWRQMRTAARSEWQDAKTYFVSFTEGLYELWGQPTSNSLRNAGDT